MAFNNNLHNMNEDSNAVLANQQQQMVVVSEADQRADASDPAAQTFNTNQAAAQQSLQM